MISWEVRSHRPAFLYFTNFILSEEREVVTPFFGEIMGDRKRKRGPAGRMPCGALLGVLCDYPGKVAETPTLS